MSGTILIMAGGTGGHVFPALAVADQLRERGFRILWLGAENGMEGKLVRQYGYEIAELAVSRLRGGGLKRKLTAPFNLLRAVLQARSLISQRQPLLAVGFGGFASGPGGLAARLCKVPVVVHEQNAVPGLTNRLLSSMATVTLEGFQGAFGKQDACWVGNPVRAEIASLEEPARRYAQHQGSLRVLVLGGSQGALILNQDLPELLLAVLGQDIQVRHQCGAGRTGEAAPIYQALGLDAQVSEFIDDMAEAYGWADLVICRAGALTVAEVAAAGVAALFVPLPSAVDDHQTLNARWLSDRGAALLLPQREMSAASLAGTLKPVAERGLLAQMAQRAREQAVADSAERAATLCEEVANGR
ncbi:undecaprenyldiphospho-muramoylpentapeptide beta-N-acetylglucosaminyltransferase [Alcanivorax sp. IL3]|jgi:UDP-N-acetylglucosamine--N-acetylmuramyl-(pentapeptide) pyrophosphoryl-undecaprenol N-acetylglucosamine transferase|uniref:undecaprenyldiphospho-muramoylpentapeptide beta-N-acetylglucosaminyltransferase n=1 Tax=Alcanivorax TaxID=59753 RepID=UPI000C966B4B|nr:MULTISPECIES: undecaprenyldiphospho-muramoylpentapeptide beta-N-acetylglucosaminyltransferase [Alcanivorax]MAC14945.1 undecaprenyldiphospho-muramoylpentapeptide beta-N-acetylglucosaminyltransferase [Alcanivorax sp.]|tara:strand:+ start:2038 stop:3111 length:1074 start_codon:yes stop_codon:yes gene_type:complete